MKKNFPYYITFLIFITSLFFSIHNAKATTNTTPRVAILDTTPDLMHPDLNNTIIGGYNFVTHQEIFSSPPPTYFHGTHIQGIITGNSNVSSTINTFPVLYYVVDSPDSTLYHQNIEKAIYRAIQDGATVINFSGKLDVNVMHPLILKAIQYGQLHQVVFVKSAGNTGPEFWSVEDLATASEVISVGAYNHVNDELYEFSSSGPAFGSLKIKPDFVAPGVEIFSTAPSPELHLTASGTSMAAAYTSAIVASLQFSRPDLSSDLCIAALSNTSRILIDSKTQLPYHVLRQGAGAISLDNAKKIKLVTSPYQLNFSTLSSSSEANSYDETLVLRNTTSNTLNYTVSYVPEGNLSPYKLDYISQITILPNQDFNLNIKLTPDLHCEPNHYTGRLFITSNDEQLTIPLLFEYASSNMPIIRGFSLSKPFTSLDNLNNLLVYIDSAIMSNLTIKATHFDTNNSITLINNHPMKPGINTIGGLDYNLKSTSLDDGLYELTAYANAKLDEISFETIINDKILLIDKSPPIFKSVNISTKANNYIIDLTIEDFMVEHYYLPEMLYRSSEMPPPPLTVTAFTDSTNLKQSILDSSGHIQFSVPLNTSSVQLLATDFVGNTSKYTISLM
ncbi:MAG: S8 family peptidase [Cellulosilyticaceae bacterium]